MATSTTKITYTYDLLYRLTDAAYSNGQRFQYAYDTVGNRTVQTRTLASTQITNYTYDAANHLTNAGGVNYTWDNNGNMINDGSATYLYDRANRMISTTVASTDLHTLFAYNGDGVRLRYRVQQIGSKEQITLTVHTYLVDVAAPLPLVLQDANQDPDFVNTSVQYLYGLGTRPLAENYYGYGPTGIWDYLLPDALGSVRQIVDANGNVTLAKSYEPYGSVLSSNGSASSMYGFTGEQTDSQTGLLVLAGKVYAAEAGNILGARSVERGRDEVGIDEWIRVCGRESG